MDVIPVQSRAPATYNDPPAAAATSTADEVIGSDFETFLRMLTTQMQNQDPLNPIESSDFAVQLATFSGVEQQVLTNDLLRELGASGALSGLAEFAPWVGMEALASGPVGFEGSPVDLDLDIPLGAQRAELVVLSASGNEVDRRVVTGETGTYRWDGERRTGTTLPDGTYTLRLETVSNSGREETREVRSYARVEEVRAGPGGAVVLLDNGQSVGVGEISALRDPSGASETSPATQPATASAEVQTVADST